MLRQLLRAAQRIETRVEAALAEAGLSLAKLGVLSHLVQAGEPLPLGQLAEQISCVKSNMTQLVDRLAAEGLVARASDPQDRRSVLAAITEEGRRRYTAGANILAEQERKLLEGFNEAERQQLANFLGQLGAR